MTITIAKCIDTPSDIIELDIELFTNTHQVTEGTIKFNIDTAEIWLDLQALENLSDKLVRIVKLSKEFNVKRLIDTQLDEGDLYNEVKQQEG